MRMQMRRVCVFCGSSPGARPEYIDAARALGASLVENELELVFGGANLGLMGALSETVLEKGGRVIGVMPHHLASKGIAHGGLSELKLVEDMSERKSVMRELASAFVALPGGLGTLDELFEELTMAQIGLHQKPCALLDVCGYYSSLSAFLEHAVHERFVREEHRAMLIVESDATQLLETLRANPPPVIDKWMDKG